MRGDPTVQFANVAKSYDGRNLVVKNLNMEIAQGEFLTMLGPSGSGKTTTLMMLAGFETATRGEIFLKSRPIGRVPAHKRGIGMVFQNYALFPHMTVYENLAYPLLVRRLPRAEIDSRVQRVLSMIELPDFGDRRPAALSGGQQQRVAVGRALVFDPDLVLMDEPLGALDKQLREQMQYEIKRLHGQLGITVVYVTHDQSEALTMSDRIAVFNDGEVQQLSTPNDLYENPQSSFVASFIGENNRLAGRIEAIDRHGMCAVRLDQGYTVIALAVGNRSVGERTLVSIRPERVRINDPWDQDNEFEGQVRELIYLGDHVRVRVALGCNDEFVVKMHDRPALSGLALGSAVRVSWATEDCRSLDWPATCSPS